MLTVLLQCAGVPKLMIIPYYCPLNSDLPDIQLSWMPLDHLTFSLGEKQTKERFSEHRKIHVSFLKGKNFKSWAINPCPELCVVYLGLGMSPCTPESG